MKGILFYFVFVESGVFRSLREELKVSEVKDVIFLIVSSEE